jgi:hypothetical protein
MIEEREFSNAPELNFATRYWGRGRWRASTNLTNAPGHPETIFTVEKLLTTNLTSYARFGARQSVMTRFTKFEFGAATVACFDDADSAAPEEGVIRRRIATIRFDRPIAVLSMTSSRALNPGTVARKRDRQLRVARCYGLLGLGWPRRRQIKASARFDVQALERDRDWLTGDR